MWTFVFLLLIIVCILYYFYRIRVQWYLQYKRNLSNLNAEQIYHHLCCFEFPFECFYGINLAFYRTFVSPTISTVYRQTNTIAGDTEKRVNDTDIIMHAWVDYGIDSEEAQASFKHLNNIHGVFSTRTRNEDFVYVLCCFVVDTIRMIEVFGWRPLDDQEKEALFVFYAQVGQNMNLKDLPTSLAEVYTTVENYTNSDITATETESGRILTNAINTLVNKWYGFLLPSSIIEVFLNAMLYIVGGEVFHQKLGLKQPSSLSLYIIHASATLRRDFMHFTPPRLTPHRLSDKLMKQKYMCSAVKNNFLQVGPPKVIASFGQQK
ncbi:unnamed protein product [Didymodactylos carnosus]|uniref:ER-bound oxygenase mpaB/mpaB'/Rubber oxygenase catalytic domain-containing protein n=1 Tax=Didymodactylos carnosus TaxID=1234261 RepID=A0A815CQ00_9BILA|nr:unnamed protein product [Didymodactylos carnosus]CAF1290245.1 unnamed protein product [Didymodactylos carnosus]CAF3868582.1 unnamed protein product [Didymodactylos carnosus]CAF4095618.1 unnamed protein product [Didymodactylos carnosus]